MRDFDEIKDIDRGFTDYETYFGEMELTDEEKKKRISLAETFEVLFLFYFASLKNDFDADYQLMLRDKYIEIANEFLSVAYTASYISDRATDLSQFVDEVTREHFDEKYFTSLDRGMLLSANESNVVGNYGDFTDAVKSGKTKKTWITEKDSKVRRTHRRIDGKTIGIFDVFSVGNSYMRFPKDTAYSASVSEIANCRCTIKYS